MKLMKLIQILPLAMFLALASCGGDKTKTPAPVKNSDNNTVKDETPPPSSEEEVDEVLDEDKKVDKEDKKDDSPFIGEEFTDEAKEIKNQAIKLLMEERNKKEDKKEGKKDDEKKARPITIGIKNLKNTCYINALISIFASFDILDGSFQSYAGKNFPEKELYNEEVNVMKGLIKAIAILRMSNHKAKQYGEVPKMSKKTNHTFKEALKNLAHEGKQEDPTEKILSKIEFEDKSKLYIREQTERNYDPNSPKRIEDKDTIIPLAPSSNTLGHPYLSLSVHEGSSIEDCFKNSFHLNMPEVQLPYPKRNKKLIHQVSSKLRIFSEEHLPPKYITFTLNRFSFDSKVNQSYKDKRSIKLTEEMPLNFYYEMETYKTYHYKLIAFVNHIGENTDSGHYYSKIFHEDGVWHKHDDTHLEQTTIDETDEENAYIIFYQRIENDAVN